MFILQRPRRGSPVVRRTDPAGTGISECTTIRSGLQTCLGAHNDPSSATRRTGRVDCKPRRHAGFAAAHGYAALGCVLHGPLLFCLRPKAAGRGYIFLS